MANTKNTAKTTNTVKTNKEEKVMKKSVEKKAVETKKEVAKVETKKVEKKENAKKVSNAVPQMTNSELKKLFMDNGCSAGSNAKDTSKVVYQQWGTQSRVLQQGKGYQLLLTNGHAVKKGEVVDTDNNDTERFTKWYNKLSDSKKAMVSGDIEKGKLSASEMPREKTVKITNYDLLVEFIKYMGTFSENKLVTE